MQCASKKNGKFQLPLKTQDFFFNKSIWILGASSGLGRCVSLFLANSKSCKLILSARREEILQSVAAECSEQNPEKTQNVHVLPMDICDSKKINAITKKATSFSNSGYIDILINCAGVGFRGKAAETNMKIFRTVFTTNFLGSVEVCHELLPVWLSSPRGGHIIQVSSMQGFFGQAERSAYAAAKHAVIGYYDSLRAEVYDRGVRVTVVSPSYISTDHSMNAISSSGGYYGITDKTTANGYSPVYVAKHLLIQTAQGRNEIILAPIIPKVARFLRVLAPECLFFIMRFRYRGYSNFHIHKNMLKNMFKNIFVAKKLLFISIALTLIAYFTLTIMKSIL